MGEEEKEFSNAKQGAYPSSAGTETSASSKQEQETVDQDPQEQEPSLSETDSESSSSSRNQSPSNDGTLVDEAKNDLHTLNNYGSNAKSMYDAMKGGNYNAANQGSEPETDASDKENNSETNSTGENANAGNEDGSADSNKSETPGQDGASTNPSQPQPDVENHNVEENQINDLSSPSSQEYQQRAHETPNHQEIEGKKEGAEKGDESEGRNPEADGIVSDGQATPAVAKKPDVGETENDSKDNPQEGDGKNQNAENSASNNNEANAAPNDQKKDPGVAANDKNGNKSKKDGNKPDNAKSGEKKDGSKNKSLNDKKNKTTHSNNADKLFNKNKTPQGMRGNVTYGAQAAKDAANLGKAAANAASGNMIGAATKVAKSAANGELKKFVVTLLILVFGFLGAVGLVFTYALPSSQYEAAETYTKEYYEEKYESAVYGSTGNVQWAKFFEGIKINAEKITDKIGEGLKGLLGGAFDVFNNDNNGEPIEELSDDGTELKVAQVEASQKRVLTDKITATQKKVNARAEDIRDSINDNVGDLKTSIKNHFDPDGTKYKDIDVNVTVRNYTLSDEGAAAILGLYMTQEGGSLEDVKLSSLMKWLGYYDGSQSERLEFKVLGAPCTIKTWQGTFLPQYLHEQKKEEELRFGSAKTNFDEYQTAATDLILEADCPELDELTVNEYTVEENGVTETYGTVNVNVVVQPRSLSEIADLMGLWIGPLNEDQAYMVSELSVNMVSSAGSGGYIGMGPYEWIEGGELPAYTVHHNLTSNYVGNPGQCTWYAADRMYDLYGIDLQQYGIFGNGGEWSRYAASYGFKVDHVAEAGKVACFVPGQTQYHPGDPWTIHPVYGHVAVVEKVNPDGSIVVSEFWGSYMDFKVHFSTFTKETAAQIDYITFN